MDELRRGAYLVRAGIRSSDAGQGWGGVGGHLGALAEEVCLTDAQAPMLSLGLHQVTRKPQWPAPAAHVPSQQRVGISLHTLRSHQGGIFPLPQPRHTGDLPKPANDGFDFFPLCG